MRAMVAWFFFSKRRLNSRLPATSRPADQAEWPAALSTVSAIQAFRLFPSVRAATVAGRALSSARSDTIARRMREFNYQVARDLRSRVDAVLEAARDVSRVGGLTHGFYRYPARFSPLFARTVIDAFTDPGDLVLDPFMGGGTTVVEARTRGRRAFGSDTSSLAVFIARAKTTALTDRELAEIATLDRAAG